MFDKHMFLHDGASAIAGPMRVLPGLLLMLSTNLWADVRATLDRTTITEGDTVTLTIEAEGQQAQGRQPDLSPLQRDFTILGTSTSQQVQVINGRMSSSAQLHVGLEPKHGGHIEIPALTVGAETTSPLTLTVTDQPPATANRPGSPLFLETEVEPRDASPFVQQEIQYTVRLYYSQPIAEGSLGDPEPEHAAVERLGEDKRYPTTVNGQRYQVVERSYAIFPERSGTFTIPPVSFTGRLAAGGSSRSPFGRMDAMMEQFFGRDPFRDEGFFSNPFGEAGKRVHVKSEPLTVEVKPQPAAYSGANWLPGEELALHDSWAEQPPEFKVGEPVTRTIRIDAKGLAASHLPDLQIPAIANVRVYPERPVRESRSDGATVYGHSEQSFAFVPQQAGAIRLPEIRLPWWDVKANKERVAVLPSWNVEVQPGALGAQGAPAPQPEAESKPDTPPAAKVPVAAETPPASNSRIMQSWPWLAGALGVLMAGSLLLRRRRTKRRAVAAAAPVPEKPAVAVAAPAPDATDARRALQQACAANDARAAARALLEWAAAEWPDSPPRNLGAIATRLKAGAGEVRRLDQSLYAPGGIVWDGTALWNVLKNGMDRKPVAPASDPAALEPLYPQWSKRPW